MLSTIIGWAASMRHLAGMPGALRAVIVDILRLHGCFLRHASENDLVLLRHHADEVEVKLVAHVLLLDYALLGLRLDFLADHKWWLILLGTLLAVASILRIPPVVVAISFKAADRFPMRLLLLRLRSRGGMLAWLLNKAVVAVRAVRLINVIPRRNQDISLRGRTPGAITAPKHVGRQEGVGRRLIERVLVLATCGAAPRCHDHVFGI